MKIQKKKKKIWGGGGGGGLGVQGRCEQRSEVFVKIKKKYYFFFGGGGGWRVRVGGVSVDVNKELKIFVKIQKKKLGGGGGGPGGIRLGGGSGWM